MISERLYDLICEELTQLSQEGRELDVNAKKAQYENIKDDVVKMTQEYDLLSLLPMRADYPYTEPSEYDEIEKESNFSKQAKLSNTRTFDNFYGAWTGRCIGCALGQPVEMWSRDNIRKWLEAANAYPLAYYIPLHSGAESDSLRPYLTECTAEKIKYMPTDDDVRYTVLAAQIIDENGFDFDGYDVAYKWLTSLSYNMLFTAERQAHLNFCSVEDFVVWGKPKNAVELMKKYQIATYHNPYREWIGAQIRIDGYAYAAAGDPQKAAKMAFADASISHTKNGIYGSMFFAALIATAFECKDIIECINNALCFVPKNSRFYEAISFAVKTGLQVKSTDELADSILKPFGQYSFVHTLNNAAICVSSLVYAKDDFEKAITAAVTCGADTDCNGATVGSVWGAQNGFEAIPNKWKDPLNDTLFSSISGYNPVNISKMAKMSMKQNGVNE